MKSFNPQLGVLNSMAVLRLKSIVICLSIYFVCSAFAVAAQNDEPLDVRILIDISGSMKQNDPNNLRQPALELLIDLLPDDSKVGVWSFGTFVNMLVKHDQVDQQWRDQAKLKIDSINNLGQRTNLAQALITSAYDFQFSNYQPGTHFILLTDGMVDVSQDAQVNQAERNKILERILPDFKQKQAVIHTIALSDQADFSLLQQLAIQTQGVADTAYDAEDLTPIFLKAFDRLVSSEQVSLVENEFLIDQSVDEFTALIFHKAGDEILLRSPNGQLIDQKTGRNDVKWKSLNTYDLVTVKQPKFGQWKIEGNVDPLSRVSVISDLSLNISDMPSNLFSHQLPEFATWLTGEYLTGDMNPDDGSNRIMDDSLLSVVDVHVDILQAGQSIIKEKLNKQLDEFVFDSKQFLKQGEYAIQVNLTAPTFERKLVRNIVLRSAFGVESLGITKGQDHYLLRVYQNDNTITPASIKVKGLIDGQEVDFNLTDYGYWEYTQFEKPNEDILNFDVSVSYSRGLVDVTQEKIAELELVFPISSNTKVTLTKPIEVVQEMQTDTMQQTSSAQSEEPEVVIGFDKLIMPELDVLSESTKVDTQEETDTQTDREQVDDQWGEGVVIESIEDDSLSLINIMLATLPLILLLGGGFWWFKRADQKTELDDENEEGYSEAEKAALAKLEGDVVDGEDEISIDIDDTPLEKDIGISIDIDDTPLEKDLGESIDVDGDFNEPDVNAMDTDSVDEIAMNGGIEEDLATVELDQPVSEKDTTDLDFSEMEDPFVEVDLDSELKSSTENDPFDENGALDGAVIDNEKTKEKDFNIDVDSLDSDDFDELDLEKDDNPFEEDEDK